MLVKRSVLKGNNSSKKLKVEGREEYRKEYTYPKFVLLKSKKGKNDQEASDSVLLSKGGDLFFLRWLRIFCTSSGFVIIANTIISELHLVQISGRLSPSRSSYINI